MQEAFRKSYQDNADRIVDEFKTANYKEFNGGSGTANDPFLISNELQLRNIQKVSITAHFRMTNNITLSSANWTPIVGAKDDKKFYGKFDGNGCIIYNLKRTADFTEIDDRIYFGLFRCIGESGVVKNLRLANCDIRMTGPSVNNTKTKVFVGALAGVVHGTVDDVIVDGTISYDVCTNGESYVGSIAGLAYGANISNCDNLARITSGRYFGVAGGILGYANNTMISNCRNFGSVTAKGTAWFGRASAGGIIGEIYIDESVVLVNCSNSGTYNATDYGGAMSCTKLTGLEYAKKSDYDIRG